jgi:hypothetical protein
VHGRFSEKEMMIIRDIIIFIINTQVKTMTMAEYNRFRESEKLCVQR